MAVKSKLINTGHVCLLLSCSTSAVAFIAVVDLDKKLAYDLKATKDIAICHCKMRKIDSYYSVYSIKVT